jgi:hypothetical protein
LCCLRLLGLVRVLRHHPLIGLPRFLRVRFAQLFVTLTHPQQGGRDRGPSSVGQRGDLSILFDGASQVALDRFLVDGRLKLRLGAKILLRFLLNGPER